MKLAPPAPSSSQVTPPRGTWWARILKEVGWLPVFGGFAGSVAMALSGSALLVHYDGSSVRWWFGPRIPPGDTGNYLLCYAGMLALSAAWFVVFRRLRRSTSLRSRDLVVVGTLWALPLLAGPPLFSRDMYSYVADGMLAHLQLLPYQYPPATLGALGFGNVLSAVSPVWRLTTTPYGPLFVWLAAAVAAISWGHIDLASLLFRLPEVAAMALVVATVPRLARRLGADPLQALWLGALSPLVLFELISSGHNDAMMVGLLVAGLLMALERRPLVAVALCSLGALVKLPALFAAVLIAWAWARERDDLRARLTALGEAGLVSVATLLGGSAVTSGFGWISLKVLTVPDKVVIPITPSKALSSLVQLGTGAVGLGSGGSLLPDLVHGVSLALGAVTLLVILSRVRTSTLVQSVGLAMIVAVLLGTDPWPWYLTWGVIPLAAWRPAQRSWLLVVSVAAFDFVITPAGQLVVPNRAAPAAAVAWAVLALIAWKSRPQNWPSWPGPWGPVKQDASDLKQGAAV